MKLFGIALFIIALATVSMGQTSTAANNPPDVEIIKTKWSRLYGNSTGGNSLFGADSKANPMSQRAVTGAASIYEPYPNASISPTSEEVLLNEPRPGKGLTSKWRRPKVDGYQYHATIRNRGLKTIKALTWEFVFANSHDQSILARHRFYTKARIAPGKEKKLSKFATAPPTKVINAKAVANNPKQPFTEQVLITRIEYADGTIWERPSK